jgi:hypothetical protein
VSAKYIAYVLRNIKNSSADGRYDLLQHQMIALGKILAGFKEE